MTKVRCNMCMEVFDEDMVIYDEEKDMEYCPKCGESGCLMDMNLIEPKYNKGDKVAFIDASGEEVTGTITEVTNTDIYDWNNELKPLYMITNCLYLRAEEDILEVCM